MYYILDINPERCSERIETTGVRLPNTDINRAQDDIEERLLDSQAVERLRYEPSERAVRENGRPHRNRSHDVQQCIADERL
jgi:hypothetical protein